ncbi:vitamin B12 transporter [Parabacteroides sp. PF5-5]|uniref:TonB-dependent receptor plug domain-containing protein n=1 Tax=unclassified Parabacteroides TaxID=2649774 RepID=UPI0024749C9F|nr:MULTISPECIES: TonB-dependent receptor [unclassified Parabacteroides]MDH6304440.1 vitamin B12 transporter [Parabacteroides sp. PH5-39]MDH6315407.1 vitamin B12 transporter [Parabacteroides sp. PF5-13]MDH6319099.1 vitamin B12 transporter [Parabacteroides sp. PH5-13]MDH6322829.1 vitamin B12 transporter [Parabacteroides sp. PH5-8]MDH6326599.1 vitamin B12 transporter [Parabacteroides sp. PH5-41]
MKQRVLNRSFAFRFKRFMRKGYAAFCSMHKVVNIGVVTGCVLAATPVQTTKAQAVAGEQLQKVWEEELDEVMVTASRLEMPLSQTAKLVTVITKEQVEQAPVQSIQDLLVYVANIDVIQRGGHGVQADISIRGGSSDQNAILLNGVNLSNPHTGHYSFDIPINLSDIERIEIIHGPSALVYGASAFSGGINIVTKKNTDTRLYANVEAGMHKLRGIEARGTAQTGIASHSLSVGHSASEGYIANSDYDLYNVLWQTRMNLPQASKLNIQLGYNDKKYGANTFYSAKYPNQYDQTSSYVGSVKGEFGSSFKIVPILYWNRHHDQFDLIKGSDTGRNYHRNDTYGGNLIFIYSSKLGNTSLGGELRKEDIMSSVLGKPMVEPHRKYKMYDDRTNTSVALEHTYSLKRLVLSAGLLMNHNTLLKGKYKFYPSVNAAYRPVDELKITASWSKSTRMPTFTDLYYTTETHNGNEGLKPERSEALDLGLKWEQPLVQAYLTGFFLWGRDMIDWVKEDPSDPKWASWNFTKINTQGIEAGVCFRLAEWLPALGKTSSLALDYARMHQTCDTKGLISKYALNYLRDKFTTRLSHDIYKGLSASWYFRFQQRMGTYEKFEHSEKTGDHPFPAFSTLDLKLAYQYKAITFHLNLNNLYNTTYFDLGNIPQPGFWLTGGISCSIN